MKTIVLSFVAIIYLSLSSYASTNDIICTPNSNNSYFQDPVSLRIESDTKINVNGVNLKLDTTYKPRKKNKNKKRYVGDTEKASQWSDSGYVEVFYNGKDRLSFSIRGEMYIIEDFSCK